MSVVASSLHRKFYSARMASKERNWELLTALLASMDRSAMNPAACALYDSLWELIPTKEKTSRQATVWPGGRLSEIDHEEILPGCSIVSCCMNRNENLNKAIESWLQTDADEIVVVDWSSRQPVAETLNWVVDDRVKIVRVEGEEKWVLTAAFNVGLRFARHARVFKLDADIVVSPDFLSLNLFSTGQFVRGHWRDALKCGQEDQVHVNGSFGAFKNDLKKIGYYNECIQTYGWDDSDLYERLSNQLGLGWHSLALHSLSHLEQDDEERIKNQDIKSHAFLDQILPTNFQIQRNQFVGRNIDYWTTERLQDFDVESEQKNHWVARRVTDYIVSPEYFEQDANDYAALSYIWQKNAQLVHGCSNAKLLARFVYSEHEKGVEFQETLLTLGLGELKDTPLLLPKSRAALKTQLLKLVAENEGRPRVRVLVLSDSYWRQQIFVNGIELSVIGLGPEEMTQVLLRRSAAKKKDVAIASARLVGANDLSEAFSLMKGSVLASGRRRIYIDAQHGLGNRLRAMASAAVLAEETDRDLIVVWQPDHHCECELSDLFDYDGPVLKTSFSDDCRARNIDLYNYMEAEEEAEKDALIEVGAHDIYVRSAFVLNTPLGSFEKENAFLRGLTPVKQVRDMIAPYTLKNHIAVHVRMEGGAGLDKHAYETPENWTDADHELLHLWREKSNYRHFIKRLDRLFKKEPRAKIYLATDMQETYDVFKGTFGDRVSFLERKHFDRSKEQLLYALADAILLSRCDRLLGSSWSSFTEIARRLTPGYRSIEMSGEDF